MGAGVANQNGTSGCCDELVSRSEQLAVERISYKLMTSKPRLVKRRRISRIG